MVAFLSYLDFDCGNSSFSSVSGAHKHLDLANRPVPFGSSAKRGERVEIREEEMLDTTEHGDNSMTRI